ncbi:MAG: methylmalonyl-CoA mutase, partial [Winogradskyella sp.]|nr:methylmalonyl-CoA mutase [Winogradskyella sp.]
MSRLLFDDFDSVSSKAWKQKIQVDLKGADYNQALIWKTNEGIDVKPFYHADEFNTLPEVSNTKATEWKICQSIVVTESKEANLAARDAIERGADSILFFIKNESISIEDLLQNIDLEKTTLEIKCDFLSESFIQSLNTRTSQITRPYSIKIHSDIIGNLAKTGN